MVYSPEVQVMLDRTDGVEVFDSKQELKHCLRLLAFPLLFVRRADMTLLRPNPNRVSSFLQLSLGMAPCAIMNDDESL